MAEQHRRVAAAVAEHQHLAAGGQRGADRIQRFLRQPGVQRPLAHVQHAHARRLRGAGALAQAQVRIAPGLRVVQRFQRVGVALPSTTGTPSARARTTAKSRAW